MARSRFGQGISKGVARSVSVEERDEPRDIGDLGVQGRTRSRIRRRGPYDGDGGPARPGDGGVSSERRKLLAALRLRVGRSGPP